MRALDGVSTQSLAGFGCESLHEVLCKGDGPGNLFLGQRTGRWRFDEEAFSGRLWMFFLGVLYIIC
jgi:hypothetical protein